MAFATLSVSELFRAFKARSARYLLLKISIFSNKNMNYAVTSSLVMMLVVIYVPFLNPIFDNVPLGFEQWQLIIPLLLVPSVAAEAVKYFINRKKVKLKNPSGLGRVRVFGNEMTYGGWE